MSKDLNIGDNIAYASGALGAYSSKELLPAKIAVKIPDGISHKVAALLMTKGLTTHYLICKTYKLKAGETVFFMLQLVVLVKFFLSGQIGLVRK